MPDDRLSLLSRAFVLSPLRLLSICRDIETLFDRLQPVVRVLIYLLDNGPSFENDARAHKFINKLCPR